jgi:hypothetical protein
MKNKIFPFFKRILEQLSINTIATIIASVFLIILTIQNRKFILYTANTSILLWQAIIVWLVTVAFIILACMVYNKKKKSAINNISRMGFPDIRVKITSETQEKPFEYSGFKWIAYIPRDITDEYVWLDGPYCPKCTSELTFKTKKLFCYRVRKKIKTLWVCKHCNKEFEGDVSINDDVKELCYVNFYRQKKF